MQFSYKVAEETSSYVLCGSLLFLILKHRSTAVSIFYFHVLMTNMIKNMYDQTWNLGFKIKMAVMMINIEGLKINIPNIPCPHNTPKDIVT